MAKKRDDLPPVRLYRELEQGEQIVVFGDPAESQDFCAAVAFSKRFLDYPLVFNEVMESSQFGYELYNFCKYIYNKTGMWPKLAVERNVGQATIFVLRQLNYPNLFRMVDFASNNQYEHGQIGWQTTGSLKGGELAGTRRKMLDDFALALRQGLIKMYDEQQIKQFKSFVVVRSGRAQARSSTHDDLCFVKGTLVLTDKGQVPIEQIKIGDKVMTRDGYGVVQITMNRMAEVVNQPLLNLTGTHNHPVFTTQGIKSLVNIVVSDIIYMWNEKQSSIQEKPIIDILTQKDDSFESITGDTINGKSRPLLSIVKFGLITLVKYPKVLWFTTKITILLTMILQILGFLVARAMLYITWELQSVKGYLVSQLKNKVGGCMKVSWLGNKKIQNWQELFIRRTGVEQWKKYINRNFIKKACGLLQPIARQRVYNLQIADTHEYFANNILVHNCMASTGAYQIHLVTPTEYLDDFDPEAFKKEKEKWRFR